MSNPLVLVFGATGAIGTAVSEWFGAQGYDILAISRKPAISTIIANVKYIQWEAGQSADVFYDIKKCSINAVVWAQGVNFGDNIHTFDLSAHQSMYDVNVTYILLSLQLLLQKNLLAPSARLCIISSIWQNLAKQNKLSYCITKSALQGLVQSLAIDLGRSRYMINAVLPGALDTPMTRKNLDNNQLSCLEAMTPLSSLATLDDVSNLVGFLCSQNNTGITGQFIAADRGFSYARII